MIHRSTSDEDTDVAVSVLQDEPALNLRRMAYGAAWWLWFTCVASDGPHTIGFWNMVWHFHRPHLQHRKGLY